MEVWKDIPGYDGQYQVSDLGKVRSLNYHSTGKPGILSPELNKGYHRVTLCKNGKTTRVLVHRLVGGLFCEGFDNNKEVNHIDFNRINNQATNLEWVTRSQNEKHTHNHGRKRPPATKFVLHLPTGVFYNSITEAAKYSDVKMRTLAAQLSGQNPNRTNFITV